MAQILKDQAYQSAYTSAIDGLVNKALNREAFSYDPSTDAAYQAYAKEYTRLGNEAAQNTLADVAAQTGGIASSYATTAANQQRSAYNQALTDKIPELMQAAYTKYQDEYNNDLNAISTLSSLDQNAYNQYSTDRDYARNVYEYDTTLAENQRQYDETMAENQRQYDTTLAEDQRQYDTTLEYNKSRDTVEDAQWQAEFDETKRQFDEKLQYNKDKTEFENMLNTWSTLGYANKKVANYFGVKQGTKTNEASYQAASLALEQAQLDETIRSNKASEAISWYNANTSRINATKKSDDDTNIDKNENTASDKNYATYKDKVSFIINTATTNSGQNETKAVDYIQGLYDDGKISYNQADLLLKEYNLKSGDK